MKFGKLFQYYKIPEWLNFYFDYEAIKTSLKFLDPRVNKTAKYTKLKTLKRKITRKLSKNNIKEISNEPKKIKNQEVDSDKDEELILKESDGENIDENEINNIDKDNEIINLNKKEKKLYDIEDLSTKTEGEKIADFNRLFKSKLKEIDEFFNEKLLEYENCLNDFEDKIEERFNKLNEEDKANILKTTAKLNSERDEMGYALSWKRALSQLYNETSWLHSYHSINVIAVNKIEKKTIKIFKLNHIYVMKKILDEDKKEFNFFSISEKRLVSLRKRIKLIYSKIFTNNDINKATKELEQRLQGGVKVKQTKLIFFYIGIIISCIIFLLILNKINIGVNKTRKLSTYFPAFNFAFVIIESIFGVAGVITILTNYRINWIYVLEIDQTSRLGPHEMMQNGFMMLSVWIFLLLLFKLALQFDLFNGNFQLFTFLLNAFLVIFLFLPFHIMYFSFRKGLVKVLIRNFFPIGKNTVRFKDFLFGDILTSLNKPFASLVLGYCLMSCNECEENNTRGEYCNRESYPSLIVLFYPFFIRFTQCINRYYYTRKKWPHLGNTLKYVGGLSNAIFAWAYSRFKNTQMLYAHIIVGCISQGYMLFWDIFVDWGLGRKNSNNCYLREKIVYPKPMYYIAILIDAILRFSWTWNFIPLNKKYDELKNFIMAILEAYRRIQWCVFRIENETWNNPEDYRTILAIPELPID